ncbi:MAG: hypothetical protein VKK80_06815 [Prochlorothrix sp.]|nr:hypothetical protein [Prochlorothrix sp.]
MATKKVTSKSTKAEILDAYEQLLKDQKALQSQLKTAQKQVDQAVASSANLPTVASPSPLSPASPVSSPILHPSETMVSLTPSLLDFPAIIDRLNQLPLQFRSAANALSEQMVTELTQLQAIQSEIQAEVEGLETLHDLTEIHEGSLEELIQRYEVSSKELEASFQARKDELEQSLADAQKAWQEEQANHHRSVSDRDQDTRTQTQREAEEYRYNLDLNRKLDQETYEQAQQDLERELAELQEAQEQQWSTREAALAAREAEWADLQSKVAALPTELAEAIRKAKEEGKGIAQYQAKIKSDLAAKEMEGQKRSYELRIQALESTINSQNQRLESLSLQLDSALTQVQDLAVKAIEGASNANALRDMKDIALEQAKTLGKSK